MTLDLDSSDGVAVRREISAQLNALLCSVRLCLYNPSEWPISDSHRFPHENAMSSSVDQSRKVIPAQLGFLAIYNPSLGTSDETIENQIVYYSSSTEAKPGTQTTSAGQKAAVDAAKREEQNEQLRQIGLAQGMVEFGRSFSDGKAVDTVETEKSRIVLHELEAGWWILAVGYVIFD